MFDSRPSEVRRDLLERVRRFFCDHGHELTMAASMLGGSAVEARVVSCAIHLDRTSRIDGRIKRDLAAFHRLFALHEVGNLDDFDISLFSTLHPASAEVETICLLTDMLEELLHEIDSTDCDLARGIADGPIAA